MNFIFSIKSLLNRNKFLPMHLDELSDISFLYLLHFFLNYNLRLFNWPYLKTSFTRIFDYVIRHIILPLSVKITPNVYKTEISIYDPKR